MIKLLQEEAQPQRALAMQAYMKNKFSFYGVEAKFTQQIANQLCRKYPAFDLSNFITLCWDHDKREAQYIALRVLRKKREELTLDDFNMLTACIVEKSWWDTVDELATQQIGPLVKRYPHLVQTLDSWIYSDNMWLRRTAILHQLHYKESTDEDRLFSYCTTCKNESEFFIRKAIGWSLRQYARIEPNKVLFYLEAEHIKGLSLREATKHLNKES